jgi:hypothetical protein
LWFGKGGWGGGREINTLFKSRDSVVVSCVKKNTKYLRCAPLPHALASPCLVEGEKERKNNSQVDLFTWRSESVGMDLRLHTWQIHTVKICSKNYVILHVCLQHRF